MGLGDPFAAHEAMEAAWRRPGDVFERDGAAQGLIQVAAAYVHRDRGNASAARLLARKAHERLAKTPEPLVDGALTASGVDRMALAARLGDLPDELGAWPSPLALVAPERL